MKLQIKMLTNQLAKGAQISTAPLRAAINNLQQNSDCAFCPHPNLKFRDELSKREYQISALCQDCQDEMFGKGGLNESDWY